ncbi:DNA adenine methylase [Endozoicomonas ascidiicola]|uniref:DNA adenine methylase n=1 Tax=Endozoicomonas ascidiicola TaxID=1698521 RepID=UPI000ABB6631|nr:DNA adenine methylase [Endozoicomonas ascidiicola]
MLDQVAQKSKFSAYEYPHYIKYMGSKTKIMDFVIDGINDVYDGGMVLDLFAGSASLSGALRNQVAVHSNDIQEYSAVLAASYLTAYSDSKTPSSEEILGKAERIVKEHLHVVTDELKYNNIDGLENFNEVEKSNRYLIELKFDYDYHLFSKNYSGTWWTAEQCIWIDALREVAEQYKRSPVYPVIISSLMYAMAYTSQGTGHYAQYRDAKTISSMKDIMIYRKREVSHYFNRKYNDAIRDIPESENIKGHKFTSLDFSDCLESFDGGTVYADPPYCFVHYSRFYHALETIVKYDYPELQIKGGRIVKGRYRENRHQSPFCIKTQVGNAFERMFQGVRKSQSNLVLSYSKNGMIDIEKLEKLALEILGRKYELDLLSRDYKHMTLGRQGDRHRDVEECLLLAKHK